MKKSTWPDGFSLNAKMRDYALSHGMVNPDFEFEKFENRAKRDGAAYIDWVHAWRTWVCNWVTFNSRVTQRTERLPVSEQDKLDLFRATGRWPQ